VKTHLRSILPQTRRQRPRPCHRHGPPTGHLHLSDRTRTEGATRRRGGLNPHSGAGSTWSRELATSGHHDNDRLACRTHSRENMDIDEETTERIRALAVESHVLEASVRRAILEQLLTARDTGRRRPGDPGPGRGVRLGHQPRSGPTAVGRRTPRRHLPPSRRADPVPAARAAGPIHWWAQLLAMLL